MASLQDIAKTIKERDLAGGAEALRKLVQKNQPPGFDWAAAMQLAARLGDQDCALLAAKKLYEIAPNNPAHIAAYAQALGAVAKHREAALVSKQLQSSPAAADGYYLEGAYQARLGARTEALDLFRRALAANPGHTGAWEQIALLEGFDNRDADLAAMMSLANRPINPTLAIPLCYAIARFHDLADNVDQAFQWYAQGGALREKTAPFAIDPYLAYLERLKGNFTRVWIEAHETSDEGENLCILIGAPRSGTTLIEQIVSMAGKVTPTGEHTLFRVATLPLGSFEPPDLARADGFSTREWRQMAQRYETGLRKRFGPGAVYTDKSMLNATFAGMIRTLFPKAKFIWCERDPRDVAWSCFRSHISGNEWANQINNCARYVRSNFELCAHWASVFGKSLLRLRYEDLVQQPDETTKALFNHLGVERPQNWMEFYKSANPVTTASIAQVRRPLNTRAIGSWRRFERRLVPAFNQHLSEISYAPSASPGY